MERSQRVDGGVIKIQFIPGNKEQMSIVVFVFLHAVQFKIFSLFYDVSSICLPLSMNLDRLELSMSCHDRDMWRA